MNHEEKNGKVQFSALYVVPGEGVVAALEDSGGGSMLFDKQGLQHRIIEKKNKGENTEGEELALARLNQYADINADP